MEDDRAQECGCAGVQGRDSVLESVARHSRCPGLHPVLSEYRHRCGNHLERTGTLISISLQLLFFFPRPIFYLLVFMPMRSFLNDRSLFLRIFRKATSLPHAKPDLSVFLVLHFSFAYSRHHVSWNCSEPPRLEAVPSGAWRGRGAFLLPPPQ